MALVGDNHFSERLADRGIQQAAVEIDLQRALEDSFVDGRARCSQCISRMLPAGVTSGFPLRWAAR